MPRNDCWPQPKALSTRIMHAVVALLGSLPVPEIMLGGAVIAVLCSA